MKKIEELLDLYENRKNEIKKKLLETKRMLSENNERIFAELAFCICTPQTKALAAWNAITTLMKNGLLYKGSVKEIAPFLRTVRFGKNKAKYIVEARKKFTTDKKIQIKKFLLQFKSPLELRKWLVDNIRGLGMKEASHFIRNIGLSNNQISILDVHILKNLKEFDIIKKVPKSLTKKEYLKIEEKMKEFSKKLKIPLDELDLLLWSKETGFVFK